MNSLTIIKCARCVLLIKIDKMVNLQKLYCNNCPLLYVNIFNRQHIDKDIEFRSTKAGLYASKFAKKLTRRLYASKLETVSKERELKGMLGVSSDIVCHMICKFLI